MLFSACALLTACGGGNNDDYKERGDDELTGDDKNVSKYYEYTWNTAEINVELSEHSCVGELIPKVGRYLSGRDAGETPLDDLIKERNGNAERVARVHANYTYLPDIPQYTWSQNVSRMARESQSYSDKSADVYVNFIFDMVGASLQGAFANLRSTKMISTSDRYTGKNYFEFNAADYDATKDDEGYMYDLMNSLSFSTKKMYVLASDYLTDVVRAFFVVPVNIKMINSIDPDMVGRYNKYDDGKFNDQDFFQVIFDSEWNYDAVKTLSAAVAVTNGETADPKNDTYGFMLGSGSGIHGVGILYGTDVTVIQRQLNPVTGFYEVSYPTSCESYANFVEALASLFASEGVGVMPGNSGPQENTTAAYFMRQSFKSNKLLFGGTICAGNLEHTDYQSMNAESQGFGVAPVPMYREFNAETDIDENNVNRYYRTASHNIAKAAAISVSTTKFVQCSAWLDYQSTHSTEILNKYYEDELQYNISSGIMKNVEVLEMLRNNVSTALDKCYDDAIYVYDFKPNGEDYRWCKLIRGASYQLDQVRSVYADAALRKKNSLEKIYAKYASLPD